MALGPKAPKVSSPTAWKYAWSCSEAYLRNLFASAIFSAAPADPAVDGMYVGAKVWSIVASHAISRPRANGRIVAPSGRLQLVRSRPMGSKVAATPASASAQHMRELTLVWRALRPDPRLHVKAWSPRRSRAIPHPQVEAAATLHPSRSPIAQVNVASESRVPSDDDGRQVKRHANFWVELARRRAASRTKAREIICLHSAFL